MPKLKMEREEEASALPLLSLANLLEEGGPCPCFRRTTRTQCKFRSSDSFLSHFFADNIFVVSSTFTKQLLPWCVDWSQKNALLPWSVIQFLTTRFLRGTRRDKVAWGNLPPDLCREIGICLASRLDILHFRSVCMNWRSSLPLPIRFPLRVPAPPNCYLDYCNMPYFITEVSFAETRWSTLAFQEVDQGGKFRACFKIPMGMKFDYSMISFMGSPKHPLSQLSLISKAYHLRMGFPRSDLYEKGKWDLRYNKFARKMVIIHSPEAEGGVNPSYARMSDLSVVAHLSWGTMHNKRLALLRLGGSPENWEWNTDFCAQKFESIATYRGRLCVLDQKGAVSIMDYESLQMAQVAPPSSMPYGLLHKELFEAFGDLYLLGTLNMVMGPDKVYKLSLQSQQWLLVGKWGRVIEGLLPFREYDSFDYV